MENIPTTLYFIFASDSGQAELVATAMAPATVGEDDSNLFVILNNNIATSYMSNIVPAYLDGLTPVPYSEFGQVINATIIGK